MKYLMLKFNSLKKKKIVYFLFKILMCMVFKTKQYFIIGPIKIALVTYVRGMTEEWLLPFYKSTLYQGAQCINNKNQK